MNKKTGGWGKKEGKEFRTHTKNLGDNNSFCLKKVFHYFVSWQYPHNSVSGLKSRDKSLSFSSAFGNEKRIRGTSSTERGWDCLSREGIFPLWKVYIIFLFGSHSHSVLFFKKIKTNAHFQQPRIYFMGPVIFLFVCLMHKQQRQCRQNQKNVQKEDKSTENSSSRLSKLRKKKRKREKKIYF